PVAPLGSDDAVDRALVALRRIFVEHQRVPSFEFHADLWPALPRALERDGYHQHERMPLMVCAPASFHPFAAPGVSVRLLAASATPEEVAAFEIIRGEEFDFPTPPATSEELERFRAAVDLGDRCALATLDGLPAGTGALGPLADVTELVGVVTVPALRRRGVAVSVTSFLTRQHFDAGGSLLFLSAEDAGAQAVYERVGYRVVDHLLNYVDLADDPRLTP
ncbi:MAG TPA: GNAT family N-acetyltransferase, partial [Ktedonobacterales bacterium]